MQVARWSLRYALLVTGTCSHLGCTIEAVPPSAAPGSPMIVDGETGEIDIDTGRVPDVGDGASCLDGDFVRRAAADVGWECVPPPEAVDLMSYVGDINATGNVVVVGDLTVTGSLTVNGRVVGSCPPDMARVGTFCIDLYEASVRDDPSCPAPGMGYGESGDDYGSAFPDNGSWTTPLYACSIEGVLPAASLTWFQAAQACALTGKRLCTNSEWQVAAAGTPDNGEGTNLSGCNVGVIPGEPVPTGSRSLCVSSWGVWDMGGNVWEWTDTWTTSGMDWVTANVNGSWYQPWGTGYGDDATWGMNSTTWNGGAWVTGLPGAMLRGGGRDLVSRAGIFAVSMDNSPTGGWLDSGFRCCRDL